MSWSVSFVGKPEKVIAALNADIAKLSDQSLAEYQDVLPHLTGLVEQAAGPRVCVRLRAAGHATRINGTKTEGHISVSLDQEYGLLE
jgi:hypothetical protein